MELVNKKIIILVEEMFNVFEFWYPYYRMKEAGADVVVVGSGRAEEFNGSAGTSIKPDINADEVYTDDYDGVIIPGGYAPDMMRRHPSMIGIVKDMFTAKKVVAAICHAGWMLSSAGILKGRKATSFFAIKDDMIHAGTEWVDEAVVVDGNLITSRTPDDLPVFMREIITALQ